MYSIRSGASSAADRRHCPKDSPKPLQRAVERKPAVAVIQRSDKSDPLETQTRDTGARPSAAATLFREA